MSGASLPVSSHRLGTPQMWPSRVIYFYPTDSNNLGGFRNTHFSPHSFCGSGSGRDLTASWFQGLEEATVKVVVRSEARLKAQGEKHPLLSWLGSWQHSALWGLLRWLSDTECPQRLASSRLQFAEFTKGSLGNSQPKESAGNIELTVSF